MAHKYMNKSLAILWFEIILFIYSEKIHIIQFSLA